MDITAIIPVRSGSVRCPDKNLRKFSNTNLLTSKIKMLQSIPTIKKIIVSSSDTNSLNLARSLGVNVHERDQQFSLSSTTGTELYSCLANAVDTEYMMYVTCVSPFVSKESYTKAIELFFQFEKENTYDSVVSSFNIKEFLWKDLKPLNYDINNVLPSQNLPDIYNLTFGFNILSTHLAKNKGSIVGNTPFFYELNQFEAIDIDTKYDFVVAELLYSNGYRSIEDIDSYIERTLSHDSLELLDCTIRDGGYVNNWDFTIDHVINYYSAVSDSGIEYFECGFIYNNPDSSKGIWWNVSEKEISLLKNSKKNGSKLCAMTPSNCIHLIDKRIPGLDMIRVLFNIKKTPEIDTMYFSHYLERLTNLGYKVCINIAYVDLLTDSELEKILSICTKEIYAVYIADTFGSLTSDSIQHLFSKISSKLPNCKLGFHGHNNTQNAISNSLFARKIGASLIDCTLSGLGRGGGNTPLEIFLLYLQKEHEYNILPLLNYLQSKNISSENCLKILYTLTGIQKQHPDLALETFEKTNDLTQSYSILKKS
jgi:4-hydroxy 2-oxovalerate aldolase